MRFELISFILLTGLIFNVLTHSIELHEEDHSHHHECIHEKIKKDLPPATYSIQHLEDELKGICSKRFEKKKNIQIFFCFSDF